MERVEQFARVMARDRYIEIKSNLCVVHPGKEAPPVHNQSPPSVKLWKVAPLFDRVIANSKRSFRCGRHVTLDEMMIASKCKINVQLGSAAVV